MRDFPSQRLPYKQKIANDYDWCKKTIDSLLLNYASDQSVSVNTSRSDYDRMLSNYRLYNNQLDQLDFERECNPMGLEVGQFKDEIQPYNKTYNKIQVLLGEELRRPFNYKVVLTNPEGIKSKLAHKDYLFKNYVNAQIQNTIEQMGFEVQDEMFDPSELIDPQDLERYMSTSYLDAREITASKLLKYFERALNLREAKNDAFKHGLISGLEFAYVGIHNGMPVVSPINSPGMFYHKSPEVKYIHKSLYAGCRTYMTSGDVLDNFAADLSDEEIERIDRNRESFGTPFNDYIGPDMVYHNTVNDRYLMGELNRSFNEGSYGGEQNTIDNWLVQHVEWRSQKKVGFIHYTNEYGEEQIDMVSEDFEVPEHATKVRATEVYNRKVVYYIWEDLEGNRFRLNWGWIPEVWTGVRIGSDIYCRMGPKEYQCRSLDNPFDVSLGYHGIVYSAMNADPVSLMDRMKPFQYLYFIVMHKLKKLIAQDKGRIFHFDTTMVDPEIGLEKTLYYLNSLNIDFYNPLQHAGEVGQSQRGKISGSTDLSVADQVMNYINILAAIDAQISDVAGINRQREGQALPNEAVTNAQSNIQMSAVITEIYFEAHNKLWEQVLSTLIDVAQQCFKHKGFTKQYVLDDLSIATLQFTPDSLNNASFGIFVTDSPKEQFVFDTLYNWGQALLQNDKAKFSDMIKMLESTSTQELKKHVIQSEEQAMAAEQQQIQQQIQAQAAMQQAQQEFELEFQAREHANKVELAEIDSFKFQKDQDVNDNEIPDQLEIEKLRQNVRIQNRKLDLEERKLEQDAKFKAQDLKIKSKKAQKSS